MADKIIVGGFHRSGTSLLARILHNSGLFLGDKMLGARPSNKYGHYENKEVVDIHNKLLMQNNLNWKITSFHLFKLEEEIIVSARKFIEARDAVNALWGFKDPRVCSFLGLWKALIPSMRLVIIFRNPIECYQSFKARHSYDMFSGYGERRKHICFWEEEDLVLKMWYISNMLLYKFAMQYPSDVFVINHASLISGRVNVIDSINALWNLELNSYSPKDYIDDQLLPSYGINMPYVNREIYDSTFDVYEKLLKLEKGNE